MFWKLPVFSVAMKWDLTETRRFSGFLNDERMQMELRGIWVSLQRGGAAILLGIALAGCGGGGGSSGSGAPGTNSGTGSGVVLVSISVTPSGKTVGVGTTQQFYATGNYQDSVTYAYSSADITSNVSWSSSSTGVVTVNGSGLATGVASGSATITATLGNKSGNSALAVTKWTTRLSAPRSSLELGGIAFDGKTYVTVRDTVSTSSNLLVWDEVNSMASSNDVLWNGSASAPLFVHGGFFGIAASKDGAAWNIGGYWNTGSDEPRHFAYSSTLPMWVGIGLGGTIYRSADGINWTASSASAITTSSLTAIAWAGTQFVVAGSGGAILTSADGVNWTARSSGTTASFSAVGASSSLIVACTQGTTGVYTSADGINWTYAGSSMSGANSIIYAGGKWVAAGFHMAATSTDGMNWTQVTVPANLSKVIYDGVRYVASGGDRWGNPAIFTSADGLSWSAKTIYQSHLSIARSPASGLLVTVSSTDRSLVSSDNGATWQYGGFTAGSTAAFFQSVVWSPSLNAFIANTGSGVMSSQDGLTWTGLGAYGNSCPGRIAASPVLLVNACLYTTPRTSIDGVTWTPVAAYPSTQGVRDVIWTGTQYIALGGGGDIVTSPDAVTWTKQTSGTTNALNGFAASPSMMIAVGAGGTIISSSDAGVTWVTRTSGTAGNLNRVAWTGTKFMAVGDAGLALTSGDGITWSSEPTLYSSVPFAGVPFHLTDLVQAGSSLVVIGTRGLVATQP
jgi:hypothetical protein